MEVSQQEVETSTQTVFDTTSSTRTENESTENSATSQEEKTMDLSEVEVTNENVALNIIVSYVNLAQKRGAFNIKESAKIWECIQKFQRA